MFNSRRRRLAWLFALVLFAELALLCCACGQLAAHDCPGDDCPICLCARSLSRRAALPVPLAAALAVSMLTACAGRSPAIPASGFTLLSKHVRMND